METKTTAPYCSQHMVTIELRLQRYPYFTLCRVQAKLAGSGDSAAVADLKVLASSAKPSPHDDDPSHPYPYHQCDVDNCCGDSDCDPEASRNNYCAANDDLGDKGRYGE